MKPPPLRTWENTIAQVHESWTHAKSHAKTEYYDMIKFYGKKDNINYIWVDKYKQRGRTGQKEMIDELEKTSFHRLFNPFLNLTGELFQKFKSAYPNAEILLNRI